MESSEHGLFKVTQVGKSCVINCSRWDIDSPEDYMRLVLLIYKTGFAIPGVLEVALMSHGTGVPGETQDVFISQSFSWCSMDRETKVQYVADIVQYKIRDFQRYPKFVGLHVSLNTAIEFANKLEQELMWMKLKRKNE